MTHNISLQSLDGNDPLQAAYQRLKEARDAVDAASVHTMPLSELSAITDELKGAKEDFETAAGTQLITVNGHTLWRREYVALEQLARLNNQKIDDLVDGIVQVENGRVRALILNGKELTDISPLSCLTQLKNLRLNQNEITDISPLSLLTELEWLELTGNQIVDISPIRTLTHLELLRLGENQIQDISPLSELTQLKALELNHNQVQDISPLAGLTQLLNLTLGSNQLVDISPLSELTQLEKLWLYKNQIQYISPLSALTQLKNLELSENEISDTSSNRRIISDLKAQGCQIEIDGEPQ